MIAFRYRKLLLSIFDNVLKCVATNVLISILLLCCFFQLQEVKNMPRKNTEKHNTHRNEKTCTWTDEVKRDKYSSRYNLFKHEED